MGNKLSIGEQTPGEADGRLYDSGTFQECLLDHGIECSDTCPQYVPEIKGIFDRDTGCACSIIDTETEEER